MTCPVTMPLGDLTIPCDLPAGHAGRHEHEQDYRIVRWEEKGNTTTVTNESSDMMEPFTDRYIIQRIPLGEVEQDPLDHLGSPEFNEQWQQNLYAIRQHFDTGVEAAQKFVLVSVFGSIFDFLHDPIFHAKVVAAQQLLSQIDDVARKAEIP